MTGLVNGNGGIGHSIMSQQGIPCSYTFRKMPLSPSLASGHDSDRMWQHGTAINPQDDAAVVIVGLRLVVRARRASSSGRPTVDPTPQCVAPWLACATPTPSGTMSFQPSACCPRFVTTFLRRLHARGQGWPETGTNLA